MKKLLMLHGAIGASDQLEGIAERVNNSFQVYLLNFSGHGGKSLPEKPFSIEMFADDFLYFVEKNKLEGIDVFGYSMGGYVALYIARHFPGKIGRIFTTATKFDWNEETSARETKLLDPEKMIEKVPKFAEQLSKRHSKENWKLVLEKTVEMMTGLGRNNTLKDADFEIIENEVQLSVGDRDLMVSISETESVYRKLKNGRLLVIPDTAHAIEKISPERLSEEIRIFFF